MSKWGKRSRVRLHSGGISPSQVRLRRKGASEKATAPGRDIRDIVPDKEPRKCRICSSQVARPRAVKCDRCTEDEQLVKKVRRSLARRGLPPLGAPVPKGSPLSKKRLMAEAAQKRLQVRGTRSGLKSSKSARSAGTKRAATSTKPPQTCPRCFILLPATGQCDTCG